jgi:hypothetical protein
MKRRHPGLSAGLGLAHGRCHDGDDSNSDRLRFHHGMGQRVFLTFTDRRMKDARRRLCRQATELGFYSAIIGASEAQLDLDFRRRYRTILRPECKGFGYYIWKPRIVKQVLASLNDGDILHWLDAGSHLNQRGLWRLKDYVRLAEEAEVGFLGFENKPPVNPLHYDGRPLPDNAEYRLTKGDLLDWFGVRDRPEISRTQQIGATTFIIRKCEQSVAFINAWNDVFDGRLHLIDDSPSRAPNELEFFEHRRDQSILSILAKLWRVPTVSVFECWYPSLENCWQPDWDYIDNYPILMKRDRQMSRPNNFYIRYLKAKGKLKTVLGG